MKILKSFVLISVALIWTSLGFAEEPMAPQPTAEHKALEMWVGEWKGSGEMKPGAFGPGGEMSWTEECSWFAGGGFHVVCKSKGDGAMGPMVGLGIIGYNTQKKVYTHYGVDNNGWGSYSEGNRSGKVWTFKGTESIEGKTFHSRFIMNVETPTRMTFKWEMSEDGETWTTMMEGVSEKG